MQNAQSAAVLHTSTLVAVISVFLLDSFTPVGMVDWLLYIVPVFMASRAGASAFLYLFLSLVFSCLIAGHYSSGGHDIQNYDLFNRIAGFLVIISLGFISRKQFEVFGKLKIGESRFRKLADSLPQLIWTATPEGTLDYFNERYHDFSGIVKIRENHWNHRSLVFEDDVKKTADTWANAVKE
ncbi:MAG: hypothetical protein GX640_06655, partial [Fibrobacter sp.]|nr:hypothetical protein [Fibrobacter sp.]